MIHPAAPHTSHRASHLTVLRRDIREQILALFKSSAHLLFAIMFVIAVIEDKLRTLPDQFARPPSEVLIEQIDIKYTNKVLLGVGLCVCFYEFLEIGDPYIYPAEGACHQVVRFRLVVFRPFVGEIITGKILSSSRDGIRVSLGFFDDILIPHHLLQQPSAWDAAKGWCWTYDAETQYIMEKGSSVRFKVRTINFTTVTNTVRERRTSVVSESRDARRGVGTAQNPLEPDVPEVGTRRRSSSSVGLTTGDKDRDALDLPASMQLVATVQEDGLGMVSWWR